MPTLFEDTPPAGTLAGRLPRAAGDIAYWDRPGQGAPIVLVHGNSASKAVFSGLFAAPALAGRRLVAFDLPGCGESADAADREAGYTIPGFARTLAEVAAALGLSRPVVLGWSLGGHVAIEAAGQGADLGGLILTGTPPCGPGGEEVFQSFHQNEVMDVTFTEAPTAEQLTTYVGQVYGAGQPIPEAFFAAARRCDGRLRSRFAEHWLSAQDGCHQRTVVAAWPRPIAVVQGEGEPFFDPGLLDRLAWARLWRGAGQIVPDAGHAPFFERPDAYAELVAAFLDESGL
jgi:pimeloyl-ACP methyl ester carboxylesterase